MFYTYIIKSITSGRLYIGHTNNVERRLFEHNIGKSKSTRSKGPWELVLSRQFGTKSDSVLFELKLKKLKSKKYILENLDNLVLNP